MQSPVLFIPEREGLRPNGPSPHRKWLIRVVAAACLIGGGLAATWWQSGRESEPQPGFSVGRQRTDTLGPDETLVALLARHQVDAPPLLQELAKVEITPSMIPGGTLVSVFRQTDSTPVTEIGFQLDDERSVKLAMSDRTWTATVETTVWNSDTRIISGTLTDSMLASLDSVAAGRLRPAARRVFEGLMAQALGWQIDVARRIVPGDSFRAVVTIRESGDRQQRVGDIQALDLIGRRERLTAYRFGSSSSPAFAYFDDRGRPMGRLFLRAPLLSDGRQSSAYKPLRVHPVLGTIRAHRGVDFPAPVGTPVVAAAAGIIGFAGTGPDLGNFVVVEHGKGVATRYGHLDQIAPGVTIGRAVRPGTMIGTVGQTGLATAPHLHFEFRIRGEPIDMRLLDIDPEAPIRPPFLEDFDAERVRLRGLLDRCRTAGPCG